MDESSTSENDLTSKKNKPEDTKSRGSVSKKLTLSDIDINITKYDQNGITKLKSKYESNIKPKTKEIDYNKIDKLKTKNCDGNKHKKRKPRKSDPEVNSVRDLFKDKFKFDLEIPQTEENIIEIKKNYLTTTTVKEFEYNFENPNVQHEKKDNSKEDQLDQKDHLGDTKIPDKKLGPTDSKSKTSSDSKSFDLKTKMDGSSDKMKETSVKITDNLEKNNVEAPKSAKIEDPESVVGNDLKSDKKVFEKRKSTEGSTNKRRGRAPKSSVKHKNLSLSKEKLESSENSTESTTNQSNSTKNSSENSESSTTIAKKNAFQFMMESRHHSIGQNSPGKKRDETHDSSKSAKKEKFMERKNMLSEWADKMGGAKRKIDEAARDSYIENTMQKRAKRMKKMLNLGDLDGEDDIKKKLKKKVKILSESEDSNDSVKDSQTTISSQERQIEEPKKPGKNRHQLLKTHYP